jgi:hypothetical protein
MTSIVRGLEFRPVFAFPGKRFRPVRLLFRPVPRDETIRGQANGSRRPFG